MIITKLLLKTAFFLFSLNLQQRLLSQLILVIQQGSNFSLNYKFCIAVNYSEFSFVRRIADFVLSTFVYFSSILKYEVLHDSENIFPLSFIAIKNPSTWGPFYLSGSEAKFCSKVGIIKNIHFMCFFLCFLVGSAWAYIRLFGKKNPSK